MKIRIKLNGNKLNGRRVKVNFFNLTIRFKINRFNGEFRGFSFAMLTPKKAVRYQYYAQTPTTHKSYYFERSYNTADLIEKYGYNQISKSFDL